jgi:hypothetical protein
VLSLSRPSFSLFTSPKSRTDDQAINHLDLNPNPTLNLQADMKLSLIISALSVTAVMTSPGAVLSPTPYLSTTH